MTNDDETASIRVWRRFYITLLFFYIMHFVSGVPQEGQDAMKGILILCSNSIWSGLEISKE